MSSSQTNSGGRKATGGIVVPHRPKWHGQIAAFSIWFLGEALSKTWRVQFHDESGCFDGKVNSPVLFAVWHNRLALAMSYWKWVQKRRPANGLAALISASRDGALLARTYEYFGVQPVRGSSSRRGPQALLELVSALDQGFHVAITPDGPRGPKYSVQEGIIALARISGAPIVPVGTYVDRKKQLRSWDAFQIPLPFARCDLYFGKPIFVSKDATATEREQARADLEAALLKLNRD